MVELTVAIAILTVVFASLMLVFAAARNHADAASGLGVSGYITKLLDSAQLMEKVQAAVGNAKRR